MDRAIDVLKQRIPRKLRGAHVVGRIEWILIKRVVPKHLEQIGKKGYVAQKIQSQVIADMLGLKISSHSLGERII